MLAPKVEIKRKKGVPQVKGVFCPFTLKIELTTLEQAAALRAINGAMGGTVASAIAEGAMYYPTTPDDVVIASAALGYIHAELVSQGIPHG